jgi:hypothetical protein
MFLDCVGSTCGTSRACAASSRALFFRSTHIESAERFSLDPPSYTRSDTRAGRTMHQDAPQDVRYVGGTSYEQAALKKNPFSELGRGAPSQM